MSVGLKANPDELYRKFFELTTPHDVADLLEVNYRRLIYHVEKVPPEEKYRIFFIPKKSGGMRTITAPISSLRIIQSKLNQVLQLVYSPKLSTHGFVLNKSIISNALVHSGDINKCVLNLDLKDFFPSIHFDRVIQMFMGTPYNFNHSVAGTLAQICCFNDSLPQGAPTSPIVSNMICIKMDEQLENLAKKCNCNYTRYAADDITFSVNSSSIENIPNELILSARNKIELGSTITNIILENGFGINFKKVRLQTKSQRQEVTGLVVNGSRPNVKRNYVRQIRAMLYAWKKFGLDAAEQEYWAKYRTKRQNPWRQPPPFRHVIRGKIEFLGMVRGKNDPLYLRLLGELKGLQESSETKTHDITLENELNQKQRESKGFDAEPGFIPASLKLLLVSTHDQYFDIHLDSDIYGEAHETTRLPYTSDELTTILKVLPFETVQNAHLSETQYKVLERLGFLETNSRVFVPDWDDMLGMALFESLFPGKIGTIVKSNLYQLSNPKKTIEIILDLEPNDIDISRYPWEVIKSESSQQSLILSGAINFVRYVRFLKPPVAIPSAKRLSVLYIESRPSGLEQLPIGTEYNTVSQAFLQLEKEKVVSIENLSPPTFKSLTQKINNTQGTILHFDGHGIVSKRCPACLNFNYPHQKTCQHQGCEHPLDKVSPQGYLAFEKSDHDKSVDWVASRDLGDLLSNSSFQLAIISACRGGEIRGNSIFRSIGPSLIEAGIPAVVSMQMPITVESAVEFMRGFYEALAESKPLDSAIHFGRLNLIRSREWFIPVLYWHSRGSRKPFLIKNPTNYNS